MATLLPNAKQQFIDGNGDPIANGFVYFYVPTTTTPKDTWQNSGATILNSNPVVLNASGEAIIYGSGVYRQVVYDSLGNLIWDQITADTSVGGFAWGGVTTGTANAQVGAASSFSSQDGQQYGFIAGFSNSGALTVNPGGGGAIPVLNDGPLGPQPCVGGEVIAQNEVTLVYEAARGAFHITNPSVGTMASQNANNVAITGGSIAGITLGATTASAGWNMADFVLTRPTIKDYGETVNALGAAGGTRTVDLTLGNAVTATVSTSANTFVFSNPSATGIECSFTLILTNGGSQTVNWPAAVKWPNGQAPVLTASGVDIFVFTTVNAGTTWYGFTAGLGMA